MRIKVTREAFTALAACMANPMHPIHLEDGSVEIELSEETLDRMCEMILDGERYSDALIRMCDLIAERNR